MIERATPVGAPDTIAKLCEVCSKLDIHRLTHPLHPCREPLPCSTPPINQFGTYLALGSVDEIKSRRFTCDVCSLVAECLDKEPADLDGECRITESAQFCNFKLPTDVQARDPSITHFHLTEATVIFDPFMDNRLEGPPLPWEIKTRDTESSHFVLNLQVKARSCVAAGDSTSSPQTEGEFLDAIGGRYVTAQANAQLIRAWLHQCETDHQSDCIPSLKLPVYLDREPTFVVDVIQSCLVDTPSQCRYVALSYVWGTAPVFRHLVENTHDLRKTGFLHSLPIPATIRDAITIVHAIGERYLWVDSLCIIQDNLEMQQEEIVQMGSIYSKSLFTIIAAAGDHADSGLPGVRPGSREQVQKILKLDNCELLTVIDVRNTPCGIDDTTWAQRAWTFQERMLSSRVLVFSENQVYWSCRAGSHSEERALETVREIDRLHLSFPQRPVADFLSWEPVEPLEFDVIYEALLSTYRKRRLTYQTDLLNAFRGVSEILAASQKDTFFWGLPESRFSYALTWYFTGNSVRNHAEVPIFKRDGSKQMVPFPSWSWAAWSGEDPNNLPVLHGGNGNGVQPVTRFYIVDREHQLVRIKERSWEDQPTNSIRALWQNQQHHPLPSLTRHPLPQMGQLYFWTSFANAKAVRSRLGQGKVHYKLFSPNLSLSPEDAIVYQDFIVVAESTVVDRDFLLLLAIEWKDGVAYRTGIGQTEVTEADWVRVENKEWRLIILG